MKASFLRSASLAILFLFPAWGISGQAQKPGSRSPQDSSAAAQPPVHVSIPGPLHSFLRMAAISQQVSPEEVLPLLAHNAAVEGYTYDRKGRNPQPTEFLVLLRDYVKEARELVTLAGPRHIIRISSCEQAGPLLMALGYELGQPCGPHTFLETADPKRAFLTDDSGFPLTALEQSLRGGDPFEYAFGSTKVPILLKQSDWIAIDPKKRGDFLDALMDDPLVARLYWSMSRIDRNTRNSLERSPGLAKLLPLAPVLDFYGSQISIQSGRVIVPGGRSAEPAWKKLVGVSPASPGQFVLRLLSKDEGWLAAYFDSLSRVNPPQQTYFTQPHRLVRFYEALRGKSPSPGPARPVFRPDPGLLLLMSGAHLDPSGQPRIPGNLAVWAEALRDFNHKDHSKLLSTWSDRARKWNSPAQLLESMVAFSRMNSEDGPLQAYLALSAMDRGRSPENRLTPQTVLRLAKDFPTFGDQYLTFTEFPLSNESITHFLKVAEALDGIHDRGLRSDALGIFQANVGLWEILARQGEIAENDWNQSWIKVIDPFLRIRSGAELYADARSSLGGLFQASAGRTDLSQNEVIDLLAGPEQTSPAGKQVRNDLANKMRSMVAAQRLVSLDTLFALGDGLNEMAQGKTPSQPLIPLAAQLREFQLPKPLFTRGERAEWSEGLYENPHIQAEMRTNLAKLIKSRPSARKLAAARGQLVPFLRDTLVGLNYAYYEPPGAQMIYNNGLFVRSHDFSGEQTEEQDVAWKTPDVFGRGLPAAGGAHLVGSLANLPYVLAEMEENFIVPTSVQSLVWEDLVPTLMTDAVLPRWWRVTPTELHAVALYQRFGEELVTASAENSGLRQKVMNILSERMLPKRYEQVEGALREGNSRAALARLTPADTFCLAGEFRKRFPSEDPKGGLAGKGLDQLAQRDPSQVSWKRLSEDFGVPHPALEGTDALTLLNVKPLPTYLGYSSRLLAESWESNNLYWARLAYEKGYPPVMLNLLIPELTYRMVANISATYLDDWPALLRSLRKTGAEFLQGKFASLPNMKISPGF